MNTFQLKFKTSINLLAYVGVLVSGVVFASTVWRFIHFGGFNDFYSALQYIILFALPIFAAALLLSVVHFSKYTVTDTQFITSFGFIKSNFAIADIKKVVLDKPNCKLAVYIGEEFMVFLLNEKWQKEFIDLLLSKNKNILYDEAEDMEPKQKDGEDHSDTKDKPKE